MKRLAKSIAQILIWIVAVWALYIAVVLRWYPPEPDGIPQFHFLGYLT